ncbi:carbon-nitrogen family hydrolase [Bacillus solitudinis]|uniref:carbon-nitrogen family hydrolase n=1 Tax=Bacillus solitudinis TaxID=2014074 RepID=UPI000C23E0BE|nr:carbon-nitrogen family hydrolase [Bacillus solitudinis]
MKIALYQMNIVPGKPNENLKKVERWMTETCKQYNPDILVLPEMWTTAYTLPQLKDIMEDEIVDVASFLSQQAKQHNVNIVAGSVATIEGTSIYNRTLVFNREGLCVYQYDKIHLVPMLDEHLYLTGGKEKVATFELDGHKMGAVICYDLRFPELARQLALEGAEVFFVLAEWPEARATHWEVLQQARAIENQFYVVSCNRVGDFNQVEFAGRSMVTSPWGDVQVKGSAKLEETLFSTIELTEVQQIRENVPVFKSRVPHLYQ